MFTGVPNTCFKCNNYFTALLISLFTNFMADFSIGGVLLAARGAKDYLGFQVRNNSSVIFL